jgi:hypothetical protein
MKFIRLLIALMIAMGSTAVAQRPDSSTEAEIPARHLARLRQVFREAYEPPVLLSAIAYSSGYPEWLVGLRQSGNGYEVFFQEVSQAVWGYGMIEMFRSRVWRSGTVRRGGGFDDHSDEEAARIASTLPPNPVDLPRSTCAVQVDSQLAERIRASWRTRFVSVPPGQPSGVAGPFEKYIIRSGSEERELLYDEWATGDRPDQRLIALITSLSGLCRLGTPEGSGIMDALGPRPNR